MFRKVIRSLTIMLAFTNVSLADSDKIATLRNGALNQEFKAPFIARIFNEDIRQVRSYPEQPPTIPHATDKYQIHLNANKCFACHGRKAVKESQAPAISITHYMDREGQFRAAVSPRRYFCTQCHVTQAVRKPLVPNEFVDIDTLLSKKQSN